MEQRQCVESTYVGVVSAKRLRGRFPLSDRACCDHAPPPGRRPGLRPWPARDAPHLHAEHLSSTQLGVEILDDPYQGWGELVGDEQRSELARIDAGLDTSPDPLFVVETRRP
jgi:hypothetical protein